MPNFSFGYKYETAAPAITVKEAGDGEVKNQAPSIYYPLYLHKEHDRSITFPKATKEGLNLLAGSCAPGPGFYKVPDLPGNTASVKGTFPKAKREGLYSSSDQINSPTKPLKVDQHTIGYKAEKILEYE